MFVHALGNQELGVLGPTVHAFRQPDFLFPERFAVSFFGVLPVRRTPADVTVHNNERGTIGGLQEKYGSRRGSSFKSFASATCSTFHPYAVKRGANIFGKRERSSALNRDPVAVIDPAEV